MSEKCKSTSPSAIQVKNQQKTINIEEKSAVISQLKKGEWIVGIWHSIRFAHISIHTLSENAVWLTENAKSGPKGFV